MIYFKNNLLTRLSLILGSLFLVFSVTEGQTQTKAKKIETFLQEVHQKGLFNGSVLVAQKGKIIYQGVWGYANFETRKKLHTQAVFNIGSVSKTFTACAIALLKERCKLNYDDPLRKYFPKLTYQGVTIRHLLSHTSGLPKYLQFFGKYWPNKEKIANNKDLIQILEDNPKTLKLGFQPGARWQYCNTNYVLLAAIIEQVSGMSYPQFLETQIFKPLQMKNTLVNSLLLNKKVKKRAYGHVFDVRKQKEALPKGKQYQEDVYLGGLYGAGGVFSTAYDLHLWDRALTHNKLLSKTTLDELFTAFTLNNQKKAPYGLGWQLAKSKVVGKLIYHNGLWTGSRTRFFRYVDHDITVITISNAKLHYAPYIRLALSRIVFEKQYEVPKISICDKILSLGLKLSEADLQNRFKELLKDKNQFEFSDMEINRAAYMLWQSENYDKAFQVMKLNVIAFPENPMVYQTIGYSYWERNDHHNARKYYKQALDILEKTPQKNKREIRWVKRQMKKLSE